MKKLVLAFLLVSSPAWAQTRLNTVRVDDCKPIGRTEDGKLVYSMKCDNIPKPQTPVATQSEPQQPVVEEEENKGGLFKFPFGSSIGQTNYKQIQGVGPAASPR